MTLQQLRRVGVFYSTTVARSGFGVSPAVLSAGWNKIRSFQQPHPPQDSTRNVHSFGVQSAFMDYEHARNTFSLTVPEKFNFARDVLDVWAAADKTGKRDSSNPALWWIDDQGNEEKFSFQRLSDLSCRVANSLTGPCELSQGDRVIVILPRIPEWWILKLGCIRAGVVTSPGTTLLRAKDIKHRLLSSKAKCIFADDSTVEFVEEVCDESPDLKHKVYIGPSSETRPGWLNFGDLLSKASDSFDAADTKASETMTLFFTSGTTGNPKMAEHSHSSYGLGHLITARYMLLAEPKDVIWNMSDTGWAKCAWSSFFAPWLHGACIFTQHSARFDPVDTLKVLEKYPISKMCMPPTAARVIVKHGMVGFKPKNLGYTVSGGEPVNPELMEEWKKSTGMEIYEVYGQTETTLLCGRFRCLEYRPGSMGKAAPGVDLQVVDDKAIPVEPGKEGRIGVRCNPQRPVGLFSGYVDNPLKTQSVFQGDFYLTGDRGYLDEDGYLFFVARDDDVITSSGYRVGPFEVESALIEHPAVLESAVVSSPDPIRGEMVKAFVTLTPAYKSCDPKQLTAELQEHVKNVTAPYKYPRKIEFVKDLPKTISGKIRRVELREKEWKKSKE
ncbi:acyl-coenzyme A synthetase ACSM3, mitochondrial-like [Babylonia areolata]|uniref:acyl-coenzyme A synthetase ACSM3, mitochondrial-like n=1 Tax=Babylonia areolata TaxID=304850 RepID=UPI003FD16A89